MVGGIATGICPIGWPKPKDAGFAVDVARNVTEGLPCLHPSVTEVSPAGVTTETGPQAHHQRAAVGGASAVAPRWVRPSPGAGLPQVTEDLEAMGQPHKGFTVLIADPTVGFRDLSAFSGADASPKSGTRPSRRSRYQDEGLLDRHRPPTGRGGCTSP